MKHVCIIGLGYIGLPTAIILASEGFRVTGVDIRQDLVERLNKGELTIHESGLPERFAKARADGLLQVGTAAVEADIYLIVVPTPFYEESHKPNLEYVDAATRSIAPHVRPGAMVILESTSPVGTTENIARTLADHGIDVSAIDIAHCPERVIPGALVHEFLHNDRIIGGLTTRATDRAADFYGAVVKGKILKTTARAAELTKLAENTYRDVNIALANELSILCHDQDIDVHEVIRLANHHPRVNIHQPGCGVGGHCIAVDPWFIVASDPAQTPLIRRARERNLEKTEWCIERIREKAAALPGTPRIALFGLAYKPDIDDMRESPALYIAHRLADAGLDIVCVEPHVAEIEGLTLVPRDKAMAQAALIVRLVKHSTFNDIDWGGNIPPALDFCG